MIRPTDIHLQKFVEATGFDTKDKSHDQIHDELCAFPAFKKAWISFVQLSESGNCTKKDRAQIRQKSMEYGPKIQAKKKDGRMQVHSNEMQILNCYTSPVSSVGQWCIF